MRVCFVGAGSATAAATFALRDTDVDVTVLEKSGGVCGRAATRRHGDLTYDYGANYLKSDDEVKRLVTETLDTDGLIEIEEPIYTFDESGEVSPGRKKQTTRWSYRQGMTQIAKRLFSRSDATVHRRTRVEAIDRESDGWRLTDSDGETWGGFDYLALNPPAPQTAELLEGVDDLSHVFDAVRDVEYRAIWTAVLRYPFELDVPYYALVNTDKKHEVGWISREECKPGHVPDGESLLVVQASPEWSSRHFGRDPERNTEELARHTAKLVDDERLTQPIWFDHQGWRYALPDNEADTEVLRAAEKHGVYLLGDWVAGEGRVQAAISNGLETGRRIARDTD